MIINVLIGQRAERTTTICEQPSNRTIVQKEIRPQDRNLASNTIRPVISHISSHVTCLVQIAQRSEEHSPLRTNQ
jgi:hypothetical protein